MSPAGYREGILLLKEFVPGASITPILHFIATVTAGHSDRTALMDEVGTSNKYPDTFIGLLQYMGVVLGKRKNITLLYDKAMEKYQTISQLTSKRRSTEDETKIKQTLTDYILKVEKLYEINDLTDESVVKELNRFVDEASVDNLTEGELEKLIIASKTMTLLEPHLDRLREIYYGYQHLMDPLTRLVRIGEYLIEDASRIVG